jgi:hypothetical protein
MRWSLPSRTGGCTGPSTGPPPPALQQCADRLLGRHRSVRPNVRELLPCGRNLDRSVRASEASAGYPTEIITAVLRWPVPSRNYGCTGPVTGRTSLVAPRNVRLVSWDATGTFATMAAEGVPSLLLRPQLWPLGGRLGRIPRFVTACAEEGSPPSCGDRHRVGARGTRSVCRTHLCGLPQERATRLFGRPQKTYCDGIGLGRAALPCGRTLGFSESHLEFRLGLSQQLPLRVSIGIPPRDGELLRGHLGVILECITLSFPKSWRTSLRITLLRINIFIHRPVTRDSQTRSETEGKINTWIHTLPIESKLLIKEWIHGHPEKIHGLAKPWRAHGKRWIHL